MSDTNSNVGPAGQAYFNLYSHRDAAIYMILAADLVSHPVATFNCSGPTVSVREAAVQIAKDLEIYADVKMIANVSGVPADEHLLADGSRKNWGNLSIPSKTSFLARRTGLSMADFVADLIIASENLFN